MNQAERYARIDDGCLNVNRDDHREREKRDEEQEMFSVASFS